MEEAISELSVELLKGFIGLIPFIFSLALDLRGEISAEAIKLVLVPLYDFNLMNVFMSIIYAIALWRCKGVILSGLSHMLCIGERLLRPLARVWMWLRS